jgi:Zinc knuckle
VARGNTFSNSRDGVAFAISGSEPNKKKDLPHIPCFRCKEKGHYANKCPREQDVEDAVDGHLHAQGGVLSFEFCTLGNASGTCLVQAKKLPSTWILLDNQSTVDVFTNKELLTNIREVSTTMNIRCNAGVSKTNLQGDLASYGTVFHME